MECLTRCLMSERSGRVRYRVEYEREISYLQLCARHSIFVNFVLFTRDRILTNETQLNCFIPLSYSLIYIGCVKSYSAKFVRNHFLIRYFLHCDWLLPSTDLKGHSRLRWLCKPINVHNVHTHHLTCVTHESKSPTVLLCLLHKSRLPFLRKESDVSATDWRYQTCERLSLFYPCAVTASLRAEKPYKTPQFM